MQHVADRAIWRANFVDALHLLGQAALRLPYGVPDPVLCGAAALELYSGGLWPARAIEVFGAESRLLITELFAAGCRWSQRPGEVGSGLWHPGLQVGINIINDASSWRRPGLRSAISVAIDLGVRGTTETEPVSLKVVGIEDLIVEEALCCLAQGRPSREPARRAQALAGLGRAGVGGRFRGGYLQRRLARETGGEVVLEALSPAMEGDDGVTSRTTTLTHMQTLICAWHLKCGVSVDCTPSHALRGGEAGRMQSVSDRNEESRRAGEPSNARANIIPFDIREPVPPRQA